MIKVNIFDIMNLGVRTVPIQSYTSSMTFSEDVTQKVGVLDANNLLELKVCSTQSERLNHVEELKELFGTNADIVVIESPTQSLSHVISIKADEIRSSPGIGENDEEAIDNITRPVQERYSSIQEEIILYISRDEQGLFVTDVA